MSKNIYLIVGPSGSGKTTLCNILEEEYGLKMLNSYTTRPPRYEGEVGHVFVTKEEFEQLQDKCAYTYFNGYEYCATIEQIDESDLYVIDPDGVEFLLDSYDRGKQIVPFILNVSAGNAIKRMKERGDNAEKIIERFLHDVEAFKDVIKIMEDRYLSFYRLNTDNDTPEVLAKHMAALINLEESKVSA